MISRDTCFQNCDSGHEPAPRSCTSFLHLHREINLSRCSRDTRVALQVVGGGYATFRGDNTTAAGMAVLDCFSKVPLGPSPNQLLEDASDILVGRVLSAHPIHDGQESSRRIPERAKESRCDAYFRSTIFQLQPEMPHHDFDGGYALQIDCCFAISRSTTPE